MLGREVEQLRRDLLRGVVLQPTEAERKPSLFGSVQAGDITGELIEEARRDLFRPLDEVCAARGPNCVRRGVLPNQTQTTGEMIAAR